jgi:hypothetical protein
LEGLVEVASGVGALAAEVALAAVVPGGDKAGFFLLFDKSWNEISDRFRI